MKFEDIIKDAEERRERLINGGYNCIPFPFERFRCIYPGTEQAKYIILTANQKVGKTKLSDFLYIYEPIFFMLDNPNMNINIYCFSLEITPKIKYYDFLAYLLYRLDGLCITTADLRSTNKDKPVDPKILELLKQDKYRKYIEKFEEKVEFITDIKNPTGIHKYLREKALERGHYNMVECTKPDGTTFQMRDQSNPYSLNDDSEYNFVIIDNYTNLTLENGLNKRETIEKMSKYCVDLRDTYKYTVIGVQHQAQSQEGIENIKMNKIEPSSDGLGDCKLTTRDINCLIGLYNPYKFDRNEYEGYDLTRLMNYSRFLLICEDRDYGAAGNVCPLFFNGASSFFGELPPPNDIKSLAKIYKHIEYLEQLKYTQTNKT